MRLAGAVLVLVAALVLAPAPRIHAATWSEVFSADSDTVVFFGADGTLLRAPFSLAARETLWVPSGGERLVRVRVSPDGRRVAWLTRVHDRDTTRLWVDGRGGGVLRVRYFALEPERYGRVHSEAGVPTIEDSEARGGRLVQPGALMRRVASNTLEWTPDSKAVVFGYNDGIAAVPADGGVGFGVSRALAVGLVALEPAPIYLVDAIVLRQHTRYFPPGTQGAPGAGTNLPLEGDQPALNALELAHPDVMITRDATAGTYLLYPLVHRWRVFTAADLTPARLRAASSGTVWWAVGPVIHAVRTYDPNPTTEVRASGAVAWLGYDEAHRALAWAADREVRRRLEDGGEATLVLRLGSPVRDALPSRTSRRVGFVTADSLILWDPADGAVRQVALAGRKPSALFEGPAGEAFVATDEGRGNAPGLARADFTSGRLAVLSVPQIKGGMFQSVGKGAWILLYDPGTRPPAILQAYDVSAGRWTAVENPGIAGWEPLEPR